VKQESLKMLSTLCQSGAMLRRAVVQLASSSEVLAPVMSSTLRPFATNSHDVFSTHREAANNNLKTEFDFTPSNYKIVSEIISRQVSEPAPVQWCPS
jgi:hypothetical protein